MYSSVAPASTNASVTSCMLCLQVSESFHQFRIGRNAHRLVESIHDPLMVPVIATIANATTHVLTPTTLPSRPMTELPLQDRHFRQVIFAVTLPDVVPDGEPFRSSGPLIGEAIALHEIEMHAFPLRHPVIMRADQIDHIAVDFHHIDVNDALCADCILKDHA